MLQLTKRQVKALLDTMGKANARPVLRGVHIVKFNGKTCAVASDSYVLAALPLAVDIEQLEGKNFAPRESIERWYKLASAKDILHEITLTAMLEESPAEPPRFDAVIPQDVQLRSLISLDANLLLTLQSLKANPLTLTLKGQWGVGVDETTDATYVIMPLRS